MISSIKVLREVMVNNLKNIKDDNVQIADIVIDRKKLLDAIRLQKQAEILTLTYGTLSWHYEYRHHEPDYKYNYEHGYSRQVVTPAYWEHKPYTKEPEPCIQISCDHTILRFLNKPNTRHAKYGIAPKTTALNFLSNFDVSKKEVSGTKLDTEQLVNALTFVQHGIASEDGRPVLACVLFESSNNTLKLVTADGFRLSIASMEVKNIPEDKILIYRDDINKLLTFLKSNIISSHRRKGKVVTEWLDTYIKTTKNKVKFISEKGEVEFDKIQGTFPDYSQLIPKEGTRIQVVASHLLEAVNALSIMARDGSGIIRMEFTKGEPVGKATLIARSEDLGESSVDCDVKVESDCRIACNSNYLKDVLSKCGDSVITMRITTPSSPITFDISDTRQEVVMPMFVSWDDGKPTIKEPEEIDTEESEEPTPEELDEVLSEA